MILIIFKKLLIHIPTYIYFIYNLKIYFQSLLNIIFILIINITCVSVNPRACANISLSLPTRYWFLVKLFSKDVNCSELNEVRALLGRSRSSAFGNTISFSCPCASNKLYINVILLYIS